MEVDIHFEKRRETVCHNKHYTQDRKNTKTGSDRNTRKHPSCLRRTAPRCYQRFGIGEVVKMEGRGENLKITVNFRHAGQKILLAKFAKFNIIG